MAMFGYLMLNSMYFCRFCLSVFSLPLVSIEKTFQTLQTVFDQISKNSNLVKITPLCVVFSSLFSVFVAKDVVGLSCLINYFKVKTLQHVFATEITKDADNFLVR